MMKQLISGVALAVLVSFSQTKAQPVSWSRVKGPYSGQVQLLAADQTGDVFVTTFDGRVEIYRSTDMGEDWQRAFSVLSYGYESALAVDSSNNIYYGDIDAGLYESTDKGTSWFRPGLPGGASAISVISGNRVCVGGVQTVSISSDGGKTWTTSTVATDPVEVLSITEDNVGNIYAGLRGFPTQHNNPGYGGGVYVSSDSGRTWGFYGLSQVSVTSMAAEKKTGKVFVSLMYDIIYSAPQKSRNWKQDAAGIPYWVNSIDQLFVDKNGNVGAVTNAEIYLYNDATSNWNSVTPAISSDSITTAVYDANGRTYAGTGIDGLYFLDNSRRIWIQCGISPMPVMSLGTDSTGNLYAGTEVGIFEQEKSIGDWLKISDGLSKATVYQIRMSAVKKMLYAATGEGFFYLPGPGNYWIPLTKEWSYDFVETPAYVYLGTPGGILESYGGQDIWVPLESVGLPLTSIYCLALDSSGNLFAGTKFDGVFESTDGGTLWAETGIFSPIIFNSIKALKIGYMGRMFAGTDTSGAYYSDDSGATWTNISSITGKSVSSFLLDFSPRYFAGTVDRGIFMSTDHGVTWQPANVGLSDSNVTSFVLDETGYVYAGTNGGIFRSSTNVTHIHQIPPVASFFQLLQNFPNPFNPSTAISYQLSAVSHVTLKVYDVLGREVATLVDTKQSAGRYEVKFDGSKLASGVYFYQLRAGNCASTKKMALCR